jgi:hypothetical protein
VHAIDWLFKFTQPQDWGRGGHPIVWPSSSTQQDALGLSATRVKALNRALIEAGLITMRDSPNGKRYGKREHPKGRIVEAYGFDLSPLAARHAEFVRLAAEAKAERAEIGRLRRRATIARNGISQILETAAEYGFAGEEWASLIRDSRNLTQALRRVERPEELALGVESLARHRQRCRLAARRARVSKSLWGDACQAMGREKAAIAIAIVSAKPAEHFRSTPGGYFHGIVAKVKTGELNLGRTIWGLRQAAAANPGAFGRGRSSSGSQA